MIKKILLVIFVIISVSGFSFVNAQDDEENLELNTDELKNKNDNYSSLTDINGLNLFTDDTQKIFKEKKKYEDEMYFNTKKSLFTNKIIEKNKEDQKEKLFKQPISFDKTVKDEKYDLPIEIIVVIVTFITAIVVFLITRKKYQGREINENNFNIYK
ncbi:MAG: hypothetical protein ACLR9T_02430 [Thomasclavelia sp.]|uniref:hypothetical protein n=1 Tax=Thomasclavelia sp. TaxID=3025757 RepID=UPI0039A26B28